MLQLVYSIISSSITKSFGPAESSNILDDDSTLTKNSIKTHETDNIAFVAAIFANNQNLINEVTSVANTMVTKFGWICFAISILIILLNFQSQKNDITTILALREFLIYGVGGRILEMLLNVDTQVGLLLIICI